ncbi:RNA polymerase sigma factor [Hydrogenophaga sp. 5NK40-0174]|uniref:RNA polymerase sigma factor n=1 Tax=Hydrogenophaga sp. 5NK40-0174 TaxID=3127649 RepID=UPI0031031DAA
MTKPDSFTQQVTAIWRMESASIIAAVTRRVRDLAVAEEIAQEVLMTALEKWPQDGFPDRPGAWLMTTAINRAIDHLRHLQMMQRHHESMAADLEAAGAHLVPDFTDSLDDARLHAEINDDLLRLIFIACHPLLPPASRVALTLRLLGGLSTQEIARAFLSKESTIAQRIVRAKRTLSEASVPFEVPGEADRANRLASVMEVIYLIFNEGYTATDGGDWMRPALCDEAMRLARMLTHLAPKEPEVLGLQSLLEIQASRLAARHDEKGQPVLLMDQDRSQWDPLLIESGLSALKRAQAVSKRTAGGYQLQAAIAACHARAPSASETDWQRIATLYGELAQCMPSPVVELNRAVAVGKADGPEAALPIVEALLDQHQLQHYPWLPAVHGDLLEQMSRHIAAADAYERAASLTQNQQEQRMMLERAHRNRSRND